MGFKKPHLLLVLWPSRAAGCQTGLVEPEILNPGKWKKLVLFWGREKKNRREVSFQKIQKRYHGLQGRLGF